MADPKNLPQRDDSIEEMALEESWEKESRRTLDESKLRDNAEWVKAIGDEDESPERIEQNLQAYGWDLLGEDDFVSDPTGEADMPTWLEDDYDDDTVVGNKADESE